MSVDDIGTADAIFASKRGLLERVELTEYNLYTEYKRGFPRFRFRLVPDFYVVLFTDKYCYINPVKKYVISQNDQVPTKREYSGQILDALSPKQIAALPWPRFTPFFKGLCRMYTETQEITAAIAAEFLVDGMNIDDEWCRTHFEHDSENSERNFALGLVAGKGSRIDDFSLNEVTCFIRDVAEAERIQKTPGFS